MQVGDLVRHIYNGEIYIIMSKEFLGYYDVSDSYGNWGTVPKKHLEVI